MKRYSHIIGFIVVGFSFSSAFADNLMQVYDQAAQSDPIFAQAESTWHSQKMNLPIAEAGYLPQVSIVANGAREYDRINPNFPGSDFNGILGIGTGQYYWQYGYTLTATQQIFNFAAWSKIKGASAAVKAATATYLAAQQSLMQRTATDYFAVLQAYDQLRYTIANKRAVLEQLKTSREQYRVGLIAITDAYDARSKYDQVVAQQIAAQNNLNIQLENLRALTDENYTSLAGLGRHLPLISPQPNNIDTWVNVADQQNYSIKAQNYTVLAAMQMIKQQAAGGYPTLALQGSIGELHDTDNSGNTSPNTLGLAPDVSQDTASLGLNLNYNPIQGGFVNASTEQARYDYVTASELLEQIHRQVVNQTRSNFLSVLSNVSQIKADAQSIISAKKALEATKAGLKVGTRTMVDVLSALTTLYQAEQQHANDQYAYINNLIALKVAAGTLSVKDLVDINSWLRKSIHFPEQLSVAKIPIDTSEEKTQVNKDSAQKNKEVDHPVTLMQKSTPIKKEIESTSVQLTPPRKTEVTLTLQSPRTTMLPRPS